MAQLRFLEEIRVSPRPKEGESAQFQHELNVRLVESVGGVIVETITMIDVSGADANRESRERQIELARRKAIDAVVVYSVSRFSREDAILHVGDVSELKRLGVQVFYSGDLSLDPNSDLYPLLLVVKAQQAASERLETIKNTKRGLAMTQAKGTFLGTVPWGWRRQGFRRDKVDRKDHTNVGIERDLGGTWELLVACFEARAKGSSLRSLAALYGRPIAGIRSSLRWPGHRSVAAGDGLVDAAVFDQVQSMTKQRDPQVGRRAYLASGLVLCPYCPRTYHGKHSTHVAGDPLRMGARSTWGGPRDPALRPGYTCESHPELPHPHRNVSERKVIAAIRKALEGVTLPGEVRARVIARVSGPEASGQARNRAKALASLDAQARRVRDGYQAGVYSLPETTRRLAKIEADRMEIPAEPIPVVEVHRAFGLLESLPRLFDVAVAARADHPEVVRAANRVLRDVLLVEMDRDTWMPRVSWRPPYDTILSVANVPDLEVIQGGRAG